MSRFAAFDGSELICMSSPAAICHTKSIGPGSVMRPRGSRSLTHDSGMPIAQLCRQTNSVVNRHFRSCTARRQRTRTVIRRESDHHPAERRYDECITPDGVHLVQILQAYVSRTACTDAHAGVSCVCISKTRRESEGQAHIYGRCPCKWNGCSPSSKLSCRNELAG